MKKIKAYLNLSNANVEKIRDKAKLIILKMTGNATYTTPSPTLVVVGAQVDLVNLKIAEQDAAFQTYQQKTKEVSAEKDNLQNLLDSLGSYVENTANGDEAKILSAGYDVRSKATPITSIDTPIGMLATEGKASGEIICSWKTVKGAKAYEIEQTSDVNVPDSWEHVATITKAKCTISNLTPGVRLWFRVAAIGSSGKGGYSDVTTRIVP